MTMESNGQVATTLDALGAVDHAEIVANGLRDLQAQMKSLDTLRLIEGHCGADPVPGLPLGADGEVTSYDLRRQQLAEAEVRLCEANSFILPTVQQLLHARQRRALAELAQAAGE